ncbi:hypothetical protein ACW4TU_30115 [Streptomyces sp. QTS52]
MNPGFVNALEMLPVPKAADPTRPHGRAARGRCIWCGNAATLNLGPRLKVVDRTLHRWLPRGCVDCVQRKAALTHRAHRTSCARCTEWEYCPDSLALYRLALGRLDGLIREG